MTPGAVHNGVAASFFPAQVSSIQFARDVEFSIFAEAERLVFDYIEFPETYAKGVWLLPCRGWIMSS